MSWKLFKYEIVNLTSSVITIIFGFIFPIGMVLLFSFAFGGEVTDTSALHTQLFIQFALTIPLAILLIGHAVNYASELESGAALRFKLFGHSERSLLVSKMLANLFFLTISLAIYTIVVSLALQVNAPSVGAVFTFLGFYYIFSAIVFVLGHAIATIFGQVGKVMGTTMTLYFLLMILGGMMGVQPDNLPDGVRHISMGLPLYWITMYLNDFWVGGSFNFVPLIITTLGLAVLSIGLFGLALWLRKKGKIKQGAKPAYYD
ncbi:MAG: ABC transporter permease [Firmicutes bacterium]|nr:ABC transporter permease [Bacillota bacterium]